jgi:hypothetical protein
MDAKVFLSDEVQEDVFTKPREEGRKKILIHFLSIKKFFLFLNQATLHTILELLDCFRTLISGEIV